MVLDDKGSQNYIYPFQNLSLDFILKIFLKFRKFQPQYSYKIYSYKKKECISSLGAPERIEALYQFRIS